MCVNLYPFESSVYGHKYLEITETMYPDSRNALVFPCKVFDLRETIDCKIKNYGCGYSRPPFTNTCPPASLPVLQVVGKKYFAEPIRITTEEASIVT